MTKIYIVMRGDYDGSCVVGAFSKEVDAEEFVIKLRDKEELSRDGTDYWFDDVEMDDPRLNARWFE